MKQTSHNPSHIATLKTYHKPLCHTPFDEIYINADCSLILCCKDYFNSINFGSLLTHDFLELYTCKAFEDIRYMQKTGNFPPYHLCKQCLGL
ncbi:SPASM domain-containing protein [Helicobacter marmotae]|uniref:SPASM domain-containing protein n=1 Tax=Helicobacter marmotae TaxID=152490 RepID=UPI00314527F9